MNRAIVKAALAFALVGLTGMLLGALPGIPAEKDKPSGAAPPSSIPTFSTENVGREAFFYVGGEYTGPAGKEEMHGAMYVEVMVPKQIKQKYPVVFFHGNGQTATLSNQTPDVRPRCPYSLLT